MVIFGITGGIGSGKSVVSKLMEVLEIPVYLADNKSKILLNTSPGLQKELTDVFGNELYTDGVLNKPYFASLIFTDSAKLAVANKIIHPYVKEDFLRWVKQKNNETKKYVAIEAAILYESGFQHLVDKVILVYAPLDIRIKRVMERDKASLQQVLNRMKNQIPDDEKLKMADYVIENDNRHSIIEKTLQFLN